VRLYSGTSQQFIKDSIQNQIADKLKSAFFEYLHYNPSQGEMNSWRNSLRAMSQVIQHAGLQDNGVLLEYQLPQSSKRLDCMLTGQGDDAADNAIIVELKQWDKCEPSNGDREVVTWLGGAMRDVLHPSAQVAQYRNYLQDTHTAFHESSNPITLKACAYLHNYQHDPQDELFADKFQEILEQDPVFTGDKVDELCGFLASSLAGGEGLPVLRRVEESEFRPSKKLMEHVSEVIKGRADYVLLDEQLVVFDKVLAAARGGFHDRRKQVMIVHGGPGTGKSVIALNLMAELLKDSYNAHYATGSRAFTETLRKIIGPRGEVQFKYFNSYMSADLNDVDVLICDEAHRIRETSNNRFTKKAQRTNIPQIEELIRVSKVSVFFIDDWQIVRPNEIGSADYIRDYAERLGCEVSDFTLEAQFRCNGSAAFVNWVNNTLGVQSTANVLWTGDEGFDFQIVDSPEALEAVIHKKVGEGATARLTAGFCWPWSKPNSDGTLVDDVRIDRWLRPWNAKSGAGRLAKGIPKESLWAYDPNGIGQVGCIYTAQGFEFDYAGVIFGRDLIYDPDDSQWIGDKTISHDSVVKRSKDQFIDLVKNTYRVLLSRGMRGCYVYFMDKDTERFFRSRIVANPAEPLDKVAEEPGGYDR
jgi:DUF2075 family protein